MKKYQVISILFTVLCILPIKAHAYIDPGTGSYFLQMLLAGLLGALFAVKIFWHKIKDFFVNLFKRKKSNDTQ